MRRTPLLILGGGPAGAGAAIRLGQAGAAPHLVERSRGPRDVVCGAFLGWDSLAALRSLGIEPSAWGAVPIDHVRLLSARHRAEARLPHGAAGLSRRTLDEALLKAAAEAGAKIERGVALRSADPKSLRVHLDDAASLKADALFLATGKHELRGLARPREVVLKDPVVGLRAALPPSPALAKALRGYVELHLFDGGYAGLLLQEDGSANICISIAAGRLKAAGGVGPLLQELGEQSPPLGERLAHAPDATQWDAIAGVPYGWRAAGTSPGLFRLGDQAAVIASLAGDGIGIALASAIAAADAYLAHGPEGAMPFQHRFSNRAHRPLRIAGLLKSAAERRYSRGSLIALAKSAPALAALAARLTRV